ncbi:MAG: histidine phosphatase family protein [Candidatus Berkiellales bacterium]
MLKIKNGVWALILVLFTQNVFALQERHLILIRHGEAEHNTAHQYHSNPKHSNYKPSHLTQKGRTEVENTSELLLTYGFDNRSIVAVYVSPLPSAIETAQLLAKIGVFSEDKIHVEERLIDRQMGDREGETESKYKTDKWWVGINEAKSFDGESNDDVRKRLLAFYDEIEKKHEKGHVIFITHGVPSLEVIEGLTKNKIKLQTAQAFLLPLTPRKHIS